jgi:hypothetical protein
MNGDGEAALVYYWCRRDPHDFWPFFKARVFPAKRRIVRVGDAGFEPATSAV